MSENGSIESFNAIYVAWRYWRYCSYQHCIRLYENLVTKLHRSTEYRSLLTQWIIDRLNSFVTSAKYMNRSEATLIKPVNRKVQKSDDATNAALLKFGFLATSELMEGVFVSWKSSVDRMHCKLRNYQKWRWTICLLRGTRSYTKYLITYMYVLTFISYYIMA